MRLDDGYMGFVISVLVTHCCVTYHLCVGCHWSTIHPWSLALVLGNLSLRDNLQNEVNEDPSPKEQETGRRPQIPAPERDKNHNQTFSGQLDL